MTVFSDKQKMVQAVEDFNEALEYHLEFNPLTSKVAKILWNQCRSEQRLIIFSLNVRYTFSKHPDYVGVPISVNKMLDFIASLEFVDWNSLIKALELIWRESE